MSTRLLGTALAGAVTLAATTALAVDVRNDDEKEHSIIISTLKGGDSLQTDDVEIKLAPGEVRVGVCDTCVVAVGKEEEADSVSADGQQVVTIQKGGAIFVQ